MDVAGAADLTDEQIHQLLTRAASDLKKRELSLVKNDEDDKILSFPKLSGGKQQKSYLESSGDIARVNQNALRDDVASKHSTTGFRKVEDPIAAKQLAIDKKKATAGPMWFDLPKTDLTPALKRDLQLLKMRNVLDPHRHYKKDNGKMKAPEFSQFGTITEGATEFYSGRIENKKRKRTFVEEVLAGEQENGRFKKKYNDVQSKKSSGKKGFYNNVKAQRKNGVKKGG